MQEIILDEFDELNEDYKSGFVAVVGRPNAGKSTLLNTLVQQKVAIVTPRPQTTRSKQLGILTTDDYQMIFVDTPGIMKKARHKLDEMMLQNALDTLDDSDVILWVMDATDTVGRAERDIAAKLEMLVDRVILVINKSDVVKPTNVISTTEAFGRLLPNAKWIFLSALKGLGTDELMEMILDKLPLGPRYYPPDQITDTYIRDIAAEMIREQVLLKVREEIPHGVAVQIEEFKERENGVIYVAATIFVERDTHKRIVIGKKGRLLREIGKEARKEIENMVDTQSYIELWVKVAPKWRHNDRDLRRFGYAS